MVTDDVGRESLSGTASEQSIVMVNLKEFGGEVGLLPVGGTRHNELLKMLYVPARTNEFGGEPIEEFGVGGFFALNAEVFGRFDKAGPEVFLPVTVDGDPGSQRVFGRGNPAREAKAITRKVFGEWRQDIRHVSVHFFTEGMIDTAFTNVCFLDRKSVV